MGRHVVSLLVSILVALAATAAGPPVEQQELAPDRAVLPRSAPRPVVLAAPGGLGDPDARLELKRLALELRAAERAVLLRWPGGEHELLAEVAPYLDGVLLGAAEAGLPTPFWLELSTDGPEAVTAAVREGAAGIVVPAGAWASRLADLLGASPAPDPGGSDVLCQPPSGQALAVLVRSEDLATLVVLPAGVGCAEVDLPSTWYAKATLHDGAGSRAVPLRTAGERVVVGLPALAGPALLVVERPSGATGRYSELSEVQGEALPSAEEIVARHQLWSVRTGRAVRSWSARNATRLRVRLSELDRTVEIDLAGPWLVGGEQAEPEWAWDEVAVDGVAWDPLHVLELPILQPERLSAVPLHLEPVSAYRYTVEGREERAGRIAFKLRFAPRTGAGQAASGLAWIDCRTFALVELHTVRSGLQGEVVADERTVRYLPVGEPDRDDTPWLPAAIDGFSRVSAFGAPFSVEQRTRYSDHLLNPAGLEARRQEAYGSRLRMLRETPDGLRELVPDGRGGRTLAEPKTSQLFLVGGVMAGEGMDYPLPLGGLEYHDFDLRGTGSQLQALFAGVIGNATWSDPDLLGPGVGLSVGARGQLLRFADQVYARGEEERSQRVKRRSQALTVETSGNLSAGLRLGLETTLEYADFGAADTTAPDFVVPAERVEGRARLWALWTRGPVQLLAGYEVGARDGWRRWGPDGGVGFDPGSDRFTRQTVALSYDRALGAFLSARLSAGWADGEHLDRFSAFDLAGLRGLRVAAAVPGRFRGVGATWLGAGVSTRLLPWLGGELRVDRVRLEQLDPAAGHLDLTAVTLGARLPGPWRTLLMAELSAAMGGPGPTGWSALVLILRPL